MSGYFEVAGNHQAKRYEAEEHNNRYEQHAADYERERARRYVWRLSKNQMRKLGYYGSKYSGITA